MIPLTLLKHWRLIAGVAGLLVVLFGAWQIHGSIYDSGFNAARVKYQSEQLQAVAAAVADARAQWEKAQTAAEVQIVVEERIVERIRVVEREVPKVVERVVRAECRDLGPDIQRLFNSAITLAGSEGDDPSAAAESDSRVP